MVIAQGDIWWADLGDPSGSGPGYIRPMLVIQSDRFNAGRIRTVVCAAITGQLKWSESPGNVELAERSTGLERDSVVNVSQLLTLDRDQLRDRVGRVSPRKLAQVLDGVCLVIGR